MRAVSCRARRARCCAPARTSSPCATRPVASSTSSRSSPADRLRSGRHGNAERVGAAELRSALLVERVEFGDLEARRRQQVDDRAGEVAPAEHALLEWLQPSLPALYRLVRGQAVLDEVQRAARLEHPTELTQGGRNVRDRAQRPRRNGGVEAGVGERQGLAVQPGSLYRNARPLDTLAGQLP